MSIIYSSALTYLLVGPTRFTGPEGSVTLPFVAPCPVQSVVDAGLRLDVGKQYLSAIPPMSEEGERCGRRY